MRNSNSQVVLTAALFKQLVLTALNAKSLKSAFIDGYPTGSREKSLKDAALQNLLAAFTSKHPHLEESLGADQGIRLMHQDSLIAENILRHFTERDVPVLCIHDSFIIDHRKAAELRKFMETVTIDLLGGALALNQDYPRIDQLTSNPSNKIEDYTRLRSLPPFSRGFNHRWEQFRKRREKIY